MLVVIEAGPEWLDSALRLKRLAERNGYEAILVLAKKGLTVTTPWGVYHDPDRASLGLRPPNTA